MDEVLGWMDEDGFDFVNSIPKPAPGPVLTRETSTCSRRAIRGTALSRIASQVASWATATARADSSS